MRKQSDLYLMSFPSSQPSCFSSRYTVHTEMVSGNWSADEQCAHLLLYVYLFIYAFGSHCIFHTCSNKQYLCPALTPAQQLYPALLMTSLELRLDAGFISLLSVLNSLSSFDAKLVPSTYHLSTANRRLLLYVLCFLTPPGAITPLREFLDKITYL